MAWKLHPSDEPMIDPFNAPDPVMPTDEPSLEAPDSSDGSERLRKHELQRRLERRVRRHPVAITRPSTGPPRTRRRSNPRRVRGRPGALICNVLGNAPDCTGYSR